MGKSIAWVLALFAGLCLVIYGCVRWPGKDGYQDYDTSFAGNYPYQLTATYPTEGATYVVQLFSFDAGRNFRVRFSPTEFLFPDKGERLTVSCNGRVLTDSMLATPPPRFWDSVSLAAEPGGCRTDFQVVIANTTPKAGKSRPETLVLDFKDAKPAAATRPLAPLDASLLQAKFETAGGEDGLWVDVAVRLANGRVTSVLYGCGATPKAIKVDRPAPPGASGLTFNLTANLACKDRSVVVVTSGARVGGWRGMRFEDGARFERYGVYRDWIHVVPPWTEKAGVWRYWPNWAS